MNDKQVDIATNCVKLLELHGVFVTNISVVNNVIILAFGDVDHYMGAVLISVSGGITYCLNDSGNIIKQTLNSYDMQYVYTKDGETSYTCTRNVGINEGELTYIIDLEDINLPYCSCPDYHYRNGKNKSLHLCKHITQLIELI